MLTYDHKIRVRYSEVDRMGFLYHAHYVDYYDVARTEALRMLGTSNYDLEATGCMLPVLEVVSNYKKPAHYDDLLTVRVRVEELPVVRMVFRYEVFRENGELINTGRVTLAFMRSDSKRACRAPEQLLKYLRPYFPK
ncbi:MAG: acyl-CoA thioesterase [Rikenellaceae bacterium]|jgi:acyl-CoA thioester hydrolase|nr:acyl-CoA thioesterase [Rikenellaceae bacterium]